MSVTLQGIEYQITGSVNSKTISNIRRLRKELENLKSVMDGFKGSFSFNLNTNGSLGLGKAKASSNSVSPATTAPDTKNVDEVKDAVSEIGNRLSEEAHEAEKANEATSGFFTDLSKQVERIRDRFTVSLKPIKEFWNSIERIAMYRLIRTALKEITEGFVEGTKNAYQWSKAGGDLGVFAGSMDALATSTLYMKNALGGMMSSLLNAIIPILNTLIDGFVHLVNIASQFIAVITGAGSWNKALKYPTSYGEAAGGASKKVNELKKSILGFDEINKLTKPSSSSGGGGGSALDFSSMFEKSDFSDGWAKVSDFIQRHLTELEVMLGAFEFVLGTVLLFTGHPVIGIAMMLHGASKLFATNANVDWKSISTEVANNLALIEGVVGGFSLALGAILMLTGHLPLGLALVLVGVASTVSAVAVNWKATNADITTALSTITGIALGAMLALGLILTLNGHFPLGIACLVAGAAGIVANVVVNWKSAETEVGKALQSMMKTISGFLLAIGVILFLTGNFPLGIGFMIAGAVGFVTAGTVDWDAVARKVDGSVKKIVDKWNELKRKTSDIWDSIKKKIGDVISSFRNFHIPMPHFEWQTIGSGLVSFSYPKFTGFYAQGGFPEDGLFMANHNELVGQFSNGKTAVANNAQIVEGIRQGVEDANRDEVRLLREQNDLLRGILAKEGTVEIPLGAITSALQRKNQRDGGTFVPVG